MVRKYDPSLFLMLWPETRPGPCAGGKHVGGRNDGGGPSLTADRVGWLRGVAAGGPTGCRRHCNKPAPARTQDRRRSAHRTLAPGKNIAGKEPDNCETSEVPGWMDSRDRRWENAAQLLFVLRKRSIHRKTPVVCAAGVYYFRLSHGCCQDVSEKETPAAMMMMIITMLR
jgi:hypothetical protein